MLEAVAASEALLERAAVVLDLGGPVVAILIAMSVLALAITLVKLHQFRTARLGDMRAVRDALAHHRAGHSRAALRILRETRNPMSGPVAVAVRGRMRGGHAETAMRAEAARLAEAVLEELRGYMRPLEVIAALAPLLGLFGTVLGMIEAFRQLEQAGNQVNPAILSGGIWEALLTTAVGLAVAIPTVVVLNWLERILERFGHEMDDALIQAFTGDLASGIDEDDEKIPARIRGAALGPGE